MNKIREYLNSSRSWYGNLSEQPGGLVGNPTYISLRWTGDSPIRLTIKREDTSIESFPLFEISGVLDTIDSITEDLTYKNNTSIVPKELIDIGDPTIKAAREFSACLNPGVPFPDLTGRTDVTPIQCEGGENEIAFSMLDENPVPRTVFSVSIGQQQFVSGTIQDIYAYLGTVENLEMVLLSRDISPIDNGGSQNQ